MALPGDECESCHRKRGHKENCVNAGKCPECHERSPIHKPECTRAYALNGKTGEVITLTESELEASDLQKLADLLATQLAMRAIFEDHRESWAKRAKACNDTIDRITKSISAHGSEQQETMKLVRRVVDKTKGDELPLQT